MSDKYISILESDIIKLSNGKRVANFSNPNTVQFTDRSVLHGVSEDRNERLQTRVDTYTKHNGDTTQNYSLSSEIRDEMNLWMQLWNQNKVDVVFISNFMMQALKDKNFNIKESPFRCLPSKDKETNFYPIDKQIL